jgi:hypothetical protein
MSAADLVAHLNRFRRTDDFVDAALVFASRERRLAEAEDFARASDEHMGGLLDEIRARDYSALEAQAKIRRAAETEAALRAKISRAAETEAALRAKIRTLQLGAAALISSGISGGGLTQQAAGHGRREPVPQDFITISDDATGVQTTVAHGEVGDDVPMKMRHGALNRAAPHLAAAPLPSAATLFTSRISGRGLTQQADATGVQTTVAQGEVGDDVPMKMRHGALNRAAPHLAAAPLPSAATLFTSRISGRGLTQQADATGVQTTVDQGEVGDDVPMKMRHGALSRAAPHLVAAQLPSAAALISSGIRGRGLTQQAAGCSHEPVPQDFITASDDATGVQTMVAQGEVGNDVPMKMRHGALNRAAPHLAAAPRPSAAALISSGISGRGLTQQAASHGREPVPQDFITASDDATGVQSMFAEVGDNMPRPSPLRKIGVALPAASSMRDELAERAVERVVVDAAVRSSHQVAKV